MTHARTSRPPSGFTLVELLVSMAILTLVMLVLVSLTDATRKTWSYTTAKTEEFRGAREAYEAITRRLSQATLNTYLGYHYPNDDSTKTPDRYVRLSELRFISSDAATLTSPNATRNPATPTHAVFFQAPLGYASQSAYSNMDSLLNTWGYFIEYGNDNDSRPTFLGAMASPPPLRYRFRLVELSEPSERLTLYQYTSGAVGASSTASGTPRNPGYFTNPPLFGLNPPSGTASGTGREWFTTPLALTATSTPPRPVRVLAENIVALVILPKLTPEEDATRTRLAPSYSYDSTTINSDATINPKNQLPPIVQVTMVAVDETSFIRQQAGTSMPDYTSALFATNSSGSASKYDADLNQLQANLLGKTFVSGGTTYSPNASHAPLNYRVFSTNVSLRAAKWSREQQN